MCKNKKISSKSHRSLEESLFPNFKPLMKYTRTETVDSDLVINLNGRRKKPLFKSRIYS